MRETRLLTELEKLLELDPHTLNGGERLCDLPWDSISMIGYIAMLDAEFGLAVPSVKLATCKTVDELLRLALSASTA